MGMVSTDTILNTNVGKRWLFIHRNLSKNSGEASERIKGSFPNPTFIKVTRSLNKSFCYKAPLKMYITKQQPHMVIPYYLCEK